MIPIFLVDNSVVQRLGKPVVRRAWNVLVEAGEIATCLPVALETGYSARSVQDHARVVEYETGRAKLMLAPAPELTDIALGMQSELFAAGQGRAVGVSDLQIAATAVHYTAELQRSVVVVHYDSDFDHLAQVWPSFLSRWIVPRGAVD